MDAQDPAGLRRQLAETTASGYALALSGGLDSMLLLHWAEAALGEGELRALHVHHGLHPQADHWANFCRSACDALGLECEVLRVDARAARGESPEAAARNARYQALAGAMQRGECLLLAQHADDQAETLLIQLLRGAGPRGLAGMPRCAPFGPGQLLRPLLGLSRHELLEQAGAMGIDWVEDPSNQDLSFDRNLLRHEVLPLLRQRWPSLHRSWSRSAALCAEAEQLLDELAAIDLDRCTPAGTEFDGRLSLPRLFTLSPARQRNLLRLTLRRLDLPLPSQRFLDEMLHQLGEARADAAPHLVWQGAEARRYRDQLYLMPRLPSSASYALDWTNPVQPLILPHGLGQLHLEPATSGLDAERLDSCGLRVASRSGGEHCRPQGFTHRRSLKQLMQQFAVPPWERRRLPLLWQGDQLVAVADLWNCAEWLAPPGGMALKLVWSHTALRTGS